MNPTHVHLVITHLPVFGSALGAFVLLMGIWKKNDGTKMAAYGVFIISAAGALVAYLTGEQAEETVERLPGLSEGNIEAHEGAALYTAVALWILGLISLLAVFVTRRKQPVPAGISFVILALSLISFSLASRTAYLGGKIRHTEIGGGADAAVQGGEEEAGDDD